MEEVERIGPPIWAIGDDPHWHKHTPQVWQAVAYKNTSMIFSIGHYSTEELLQSRPFQPIFVNALGAFSAALHLIQYGLAWQRQGGQFNTWASMGFPTSSAHLLVIRHLLGAHVVNLQNWWEINHEEGDNPLRYGGYDSLHLEGHWDGPRIRNRKEESFNLTSAQTSYVLNESAWPSNRLILETDKYQGWYELLTRIGNLNHIPDQVIDVYCQPVGWLGRFSKSSTTGKWHCTSEEIHTWGHPK